MASYRKAIKGLKIITFKNKQSCSVCRVKAPEGVPFAITVDSEKINCNPSFRICPNCFHSVSLVLQDKLEKCSEEIKEVYVTKRFTEML